MSFADAAERHLDDVYGYLAWFTGDRFVAEDLAGETFERALRLWHRFDPDRGSARTWLCQVARTVALDHFRSEKRRAAPRGARGGAGGVRAAARRGLLARARVGPARADCRRARGDRAAGRARPRRIAPPLACSGSRPPTARRASTARSRSSRRPSMSQLDLIAHLRERRPVAPAELRERVRQIAARAPEPHRRFTSRRALVVLAPVAAAAALAAAFLPRGGNQNSFEDTSRTLAPAYQESGTAGDLVGGRPDLEGDRRLGPRPARPPPTSGSRAQRYSATLTLRLPTPNAVSAATTKALRITAALGGYPQTVRVDAGGKNGSAYLVLKVPRNRVQDAVRRLGALGTIVGENVSIQDLQAGVDATARTIAQLQARLSALRAQPRDRRAEASDRDAHDAGRAAPAPARGHAARGAVRDRRAPARDAAGDRAEPGPGRATPRPRRGVPLGRHRCGLRARVRCAARPARRARLVPRPRPSPPARGEAARPALSVRL